MWQGLKAMLPVIPYNLFPQPCLLCASAGPRALCPDCEFDLPYLTRHLYRCTTCALPLSGESRYCGHCLQTPPAFDRCRVLASYEHPLDQLIHAFKYRGKLAPGRLLATLMGDLLRAERDESDAAEWPELIIPVPMHWTRRLQRGFNQTELLATDLGRALQLPVHSRLCRRQHRTERQQGLTRTARMHNLRDAFALRPHAKRLIAGRRIALLDDVVTTTSTVRALSRLLRNQGADTVEVWALARTPEAHLRQPTSN